MNKAPKLTRRQLLTIGASGLAVLGVVGTAGLYLPPAAPAGLVLSISERAIVAAIGATLFTGGGFPVSGDSELFVNEVDSILQNVTMQPHRSALRYLIRSVEFGSTPTHRARFSQLPDTDRTVILNTWASSSLYTRRLAFQSLKLIMAMAYFSLPEVRDHMGWDTICRGDL